MGIDAGLHRTSRKAGWIPKRIYRMARERFAAAVTALAAFATVAAAAGCDYIAEQPEVNPDRFAPPAVEREWQPPGSSMTGSYSPATKFVEVPIAPAQPSGSHSYDMSAL